MTAFSKENGVSYSFIKTNRFKTTLISVGFYLPLNNYAAANTLACNLMKSGTVDLPDLYSLNRKLASLYGAQISSWSSKSGDNQELRINITVNDSKYSIDGQNTVSDAGKLLCDMIFGRFFDNSDYPLAALKREKRLLKEKIASEINDKRVYSRKRCEEIMCQNEPYGISPDGTVDEVSALQSSDVRLALERLIKTAFISVLVIGNEEPSLFVEEFEKCISLCKRQYSPIAQSTAYAAGELKSISEKMDVNQGKLVMGFRTTEHGDDIKTIATRVMTDIFGGGPYSKLFCNVREKMSLCYYCSARCIRQKGLLFVESGVEKKNIESAKNAILAQFDDVANGNFTEKDMTSSKLSLCDSISSVESDQNMLLFWYAARALEDNPPTPREVCEAIEKVTFDDIKNAAKGFCLDAVFTLCPDKTAKEEE